ncbi:MAG: MoxR family ATPase [Bacteroidetes bacterium]|nr:MoxR family ATPase [Bacteroidota bacterium]
MEIPLFEQRIDIQKIQDVVTQMKTEIAKVVVGQEAMIEMMLAAILSNGHILLEGVPGVAKTLTAKLIAKTMDVEFSRIQFTPDLMPSDVMGTNVFNPKISDFEFRKGPVFSNIVLIDEINRAPAKTQSALFEVMEERRITIDRTTHELQLPFMVIATQNPIEHEGTYQLPEAQLDRFAFKLIVGYPSLTQEVEILHRHQYQFSMHNVLDKVNKVLDASLLDELKTLVSQISIEDKLLEYIAGMIQQTRNHGGLLLGASPRASITILNTSKALAALRGRDFVTPEDIIHVSAPALRHRLSLSAEKEMEGISTDDIVAEIIKEMEIPR